MRAAARVALARGRESCWLMRRESGDWKRFRSLPDLVEVKLPLADEPERMNPGPCEEPRESFAAEVHRRTLEALQAAHRDHKQFVMFVHGSPPIRRGRTTSRSIVRALMRRRSATLYIVRSECIQHEAVFVAAIRQGAS